ncbi:unnamed protein product [Somion occarium]|uniref:Acyl-CoA thioesterase-like N-terminal HotDog domain-containing protein n=1 Tax=Somion occarium TaxID=3059160 RepID=A0ABP1DIA6_9APHY
MAPLVQAIHLEFSHNLPGDIFVYKGNVDPDWTVGAVPNGGYVLSLILEAAVKHQSPKAHPDPIHVTAHFLRSAATSTFEVHIHILKAGRGFTNLTANLVQNGEVKVMTHMVFGVLASPSDPTTPTLTVEPPSPYARRIPLYTHPSKCSPDRPEWRFGYSKYIQTAHCPVHVKNAEIPREGMEWGLYLTLTDPSEQWTTSAIPFATDTFRALHQVVPSHKDVRRVSWAPTMVMTIEFKFPIPKPSSPDHSPRTVAVYSSGRFINDPQARHDTYIEIWTAPSNIGEGSEQGDWREKQRCLAVSTQMALLVPMEVNKRRGEKAQAGSKL